MSTLNNAFQHLYDRLTSDMAAHDQVRLILNSHQLDKSISLPFLQRDRLTPERFLAAIERVVQSLLLLLLLLINSPNIWFFRLIYK
jgi:hypothetical protein